MGGQSAFRSFMCVCVSPGYFFLFFLSATHTHTQSHKSDVSVQIGCIVPPDPGEPDSSSQVADATLRLQISEPFLLILSCKVQT